MEQVTLEPEKDGGSEGATDIGNKREHKGEIDKKPTEWATEKHASASLKLMKTLRCRARSQAEGAVGERKLILGSSLA